MPYLTPDDHRAYADFVALHLAPFMRPPPGILWHYTNGDALVRIIESGEIFSTQIACLNDSTEFVFAERLLKGALEVARPVNSDDTWLRDSMLANFREERPVKEGRFVTCFTSRFDDLSQWRAYSGGENGYAIGFDSAALRSFYNTGNPMLLPVSYDDATHQGLSTAIAEATFRFFRAAVANRKPPSREVLREEFFDAFGKLVGLFAPLVKDRSFEAEAEWRLVHQLEPSEVHNVVIRQKPSLLARHLPLRPRVGSRMPLAQVLVGPSRHKEVSSFD